MKAAAFFDWRPRCRAPPFPISFWIFKKLTGGKTNAKLEKPQNLQKG